MDRAGEELGAAKALIEKDLSNVAISPAYYVMFNAAKAALSERDEHSRTHKGTWGLFRAAFVVTGRFDPQLHSLAVKGQAMRVRSAYKTERFSEDGARELVEGAERFVAAIEAMLTRERE
jgi:uncharacterized protein (UPF0332 family)